MLDNVKYCSSSLGKLIEHQIFPAALVIALIILFSAMEVSAAFEYDYGSKTRLCNSFKYDFHFESSPECLKLLRCLILESYSKSDLLELCINNWISNKSHSPTRGTRYGVKRADRKCLLPALNICVGECTSRLTTDYLTVA